MAKTFIMLAALRGLLAVALGAFGAHGLKQQLSEDMLAVYQTGVQYHFYHCLALLAVAIMIMLQPNIAELRWSAWAFVVGQLVFCGSLYILAISGVRGLGAITPLGGLAFIAGWFLLALAAYRHIE